MTTHSPSFYLLADERAAKFYVRKNDKGLSDPLQGRDLERLDIEQAVGEGFYLPAVAEAVKNVATLEARAKLAEATNSDLKAELQAIATPVVLTEGRTDARILLVAWEKRRGGVPPFSIRSCETGGENAGSGDGGAQRLAIRLKGVAADHPHAVIGLFDYDDKGLSAYKLDRNFVKDNIGEFFVKRGMHGQSYAACLPAPEFRRECKEYENLPIEFLFRDEHLSAEVDGKKLVLTQKKASTKVGGRKIEKTLDDVTHFKDVGSGKTDFAEVIVRTFNEDAFDAFDAVFAMIESIIEHNQQRN